MKATITQIQRFSVHDGPGIRTTVFFKGCNLRCLWCHNPETLSPKIQLEHFSARCATCGKCAAVCPNHAISICDGVYRKDTSLCASCFECSKVCLTSALTVCGSEYTIDDVCETVLRDRKYYEKSSGGVTFSGGEPLLQSEFVFECVKKLKAEGIHCAVETANNLPESVVLDAISHFDLFMCDIKAMDCELHKKLTGVTNERILHNISLIAGSGKPVLIRVPVAMTLNGTVENLTATADFMRSVGLKNIELLKLHRLGEHKYDALGLPMTHPDVPETTDADIEEFYKIFSDGFIRGF